MRKRVLSITIVFFLLMTVYVPVSSAAELSETQMKAFDKAVFEAMQCIDKEQMAEEESALAIHDYLASTVAGV